MRRVHGPGFRGVGVKKGPGLLGYAIFCSAQAALPSVVQRRK